MKTPPKQRLSLITRSLAAASKRLNKFMEKLAKKKRSEFAQAALDFTLDHPEAFILLGDPKTDVMFMAYQNIQVPLHFVNTDGSSMHIVRDALAYQKGPRGEKSVDQFLLAVDSGIVALANEQYNRRRKTLVQKVLGGASKKLTVIDETRNPFKATEPSQS